MSANSRLLAQLGLAFRYHVVWTVDETVYRGHFECTIADRELNELYRSHLNNTVSARVFYPGKFLWELSTGNMGTESVLAKYYPVRRYFRINPNGSSGDFPAYHYRILLNETFQNGLGHTKSRNATRWERNSLTCVLDDTPLTSFYTKERKFQIGIIESMWQWRALLNAKCSPVTTSPQYDSGTEGFQFPSPSFSSFSDEKETISEDEIE